MKSGTTNPNLKSKLPWLAAAVIVLIGLWALWHGRAQKSSAEPPAPTAGVVAVTRQDLSKQVTISAEFRPYVEAQLNAKVSG